MSKAKTSKNCPVHNTIGDEDEICTCRPTATPYAVNGTRIESADEHGWANDGWIIAECKGDDRHANVAFLVAAANSHQALVDALKLMISPVEHLPGCLWLDDKRMPCQCDVQGRVSRAIEQAKAALALANPQKGNEKQ